ncbi:hypothetical protein RN001_002250 [Aquatica leii]|uniref:Methyltransferase domain-containing protein n=1 Tax=Aquatica leii TaxID=1421715 RepID=A0AAN7Q503_9COLE|nr:hypothetical protein RN001_002250 [Aquatica leii]
MCDSHVIAGYLLNGNKHISMSIKHISIGYDSYLEYFTAVLNFLKDEQWIYNYRNTHILVNNVLDNFQPDWIEHFQYITSNELNNLPFGYINSNWPESLQNFLKKITNLKYGIEVYRFGSELPVLQSRHRLSVKKQHEIVRLTAVIHDLCQKYDITVIIDIGAGLGYLSYLLYEKYDYKILAIEGNKDTYELAIRNQEKYHANTKEDIKFIHHFITNNSESNIRMLLENLNWSLNKICVTGLHACADLSITILDVFKKLELAQSLAIMPCCYHRLEMSHVSADGEMFENFPISQVLSDVYENLNGKLFLKKPFLRLACQQTESAWKHMSDEDHAIHSKSCILRAILQEFANEENLKIERLKRKSGKLINNVKEYINNVKFTHKLIRPDGSDYVINEDVFLKTMMGKWKSYKDKCYLVEVLTAFQTAIQSICENIILLDRVQYLSEKGIKCDIYKVTDDHISPRCHALVANK